MSIESLKQQARRHEQNEEWKKALDQYRKALDELARDEQVDIGLYNRVGDICVRLGDLGAAVENYDKAVDLYREAYLPNNAIAVCKKIIRNVPERHQAYLRIGQIRAEQGFLPDARTNFLTYAERMQHAGDLDESFRALIEFCDLAPDDVGVRVTVADQMVAQGRPSEAVEQLLLARQRFAQTGEHGQAEELENRILALDPDADLSAVTAVAMGGRESTVGDDGEIVADFGDIDLGGDDDGFGRAEAAAAQPLGTDDVQVGEPAELGDFEVDASEDVEFLTVGASDEGDDAVPADGLPAMDFGDPAENAEDEPFELATVDFEVTDEAEDEGEAVELPTMDFGDADDEEPAFELPTMDFGDDDEEDAPDEAVDLPTMDIAADTDQEDEAVELPMMDFGDTPAADALDEPDVVAAEAVSEASEAVEEAVEEASSGAVDSEEDVDVTEEAAVETTEAASAPDEGYVDLGAMILGGQEEKSTRFTVAYEEPSGDEEADFAKMLSQFKEKVSENLDSGDVRAHYDLGTAYKEMGLLDEAISSFQAALRASSDHLPTYELMGQTFIEMGQAEAAVNSLRRALEVDSGVEDDLVGIYYYLARAYEELEDGASAVAYYDKVFALDINFADVTERLRELR